MKNMKVKAKLIVSFLFVVLLAIAVGVVGIIGMSQINAADDDLYKMNLLAISAMADFREAYQSERTQLRAMILSIGDPAAVQASINGFAELEKTAENAMKAYEDTIEDETEEKGYYGAKAAYTGEYDKAKQAMQQAALAGDFELAYQLLKDAGPVVAPIVTGLQESARLNNDWAKDAVDANTSLFNLMTWLEIGILLLAIIVAISLSLYISSLISKPLNVLTTFMKKAGTYGDISLSKDDVALIEACSLVRDETGQCISSTASFVKHITVISEELESVANGDLSIDVNLLSEQDTLGLSVKKMVDNLSTMFNEINASSDQVSSGSKQIADGAQSLAQGSTEQASAVEELSASISEVSNSIQSAAGAARGAAQKADSIRQMAEQGSSQMNSMLDAVHDINEASQSIGKVITVIDNIAFQTNILALNAAVEAARAGQHGRGFAVVAEEVRSLAAKSADAAKETGVLIQNSIEKAELGARIAAETSTSLQEIVAGINETSSIVSNIAVSAEEQAVAIKQINTGIDQVAQVVQQNSATAEESAAASEEMSGQSVILQDLISQFKLRSSGAPRLGASAAPAKHRKLEMPAPHSTTTAYAPNEGGYGKY